MESEKLYYIILASFVMPIGLSIGLIWFFISYQKRKSEYQLSLKDEELKRQALIIEKQSALSEERTRIASEMHDDLGGGLTTIKFLSQKVLRKSEDEGIKNQVKKIVTQSETLVNNMSEIIWAMNAGFDTLSSLISYSRRYAHEYLETHGIELSFKVDGKATNIKLSGTERRNIFLVIKELLHNTVKHAQASIVNIKFVVDAEGLKIEINDNGTGITEEDELGNGLKNMKVRMEKIGGTYAHENEKGLRTKLTLPNTNFLG